MTSSGWAVSPPFPPPCPGRFARGAMSASCCPVIGTSSNSSPTLKSLDNAPLWRKCRPARSGGRRPGTACRFTSCSARNLYDRPGNPYGDESGRDWPDNDVRFGRFASAAAELAMGTLDKNWAADLVHANDWQAALAPAYLAWKGCKGPLDPDHPQPRLPGTVPAGLAAPDRRARKLLPHRRARILRQAVVPQGRHRLRLASDHRQRDLCEGDHDARTRLRARRSAPAAARTPRN